VSRRVRAAASQLLRFQIARGGQMLQLQITPMAVVVSPTERAGRIGVDFRETILVRDGPVQAVHTRCCGLGDLGVFIADARRMMVGRASWRNLSGPVTIADVAGQSARIGSLPI